MRVLCPNCGTEFETPTTEQLEQGVVINPNEFDGDAFLIPKENNNNETNTNQEETIMNNTNTFDMDALARMVAEQIKSNATIANALNNATTEVSTELDDTKVDGGMWAKTSKYYGVERCGYAFNPYLVRRFLPKQFLGMMNKYKLQINEGIRCEYSYMKSIEVTMNECKVLANMSRFNDMIAFTERREFFSVWDCKAIFMDYMDNIVIHIQNQLNKVQNRQKYIKVHGFGRLNVVKHQEIVKDRIVTTYTLEDESIYNYIKETKLALQNAGTYKKLYDIMKGFRQIVIPSRVQKVWEYDYTNHKGSYKRKINHDGFELYPVFFENFKKAGAYYTIKNLLWFEDEDRLGFKLDGRSGREAIDYLRGLINEPSFILYAKLKDGVKNSLIDLEKYNL